MQAELARLEHAYYVLDNPLLPDIEYDRLYRELLDIEVAHPEWVTSESLSQRVGGTALKEFDSVIHEVPMPLRKLSLSLLIAVVVKAYI